jgi:uncharacterized protein (TIGR03083 family)
MLPVMTMLPPALLLDRIRSESARLAEVGRMGTTAAVPACPGWTVGSLLEHVAVVYLHKVVAMQTNAQPDPWPPDFSGRDPLELFDEARSRLIAELEARGPDQPAWTFWADDQTSGFWLRRMAHESAVHRVDAEQAHDVVTPLDPELALDGIDEVLTIMLGGPWWDDETEEPVDASVRITSGGRSWTATIDRISAVVAEGTEGDVAAEIFGEPEDLLLWLWGRRPGEAIGIAGDDDTADRFHRRLTEALT